MVDRLRLRLVCERIGLRVEGRLVCGGGSILAAAAEGVVWWGVVIFVAVVSCRAGRVGM